jgi:hypothetical protein
MHDRSTSRPGDRRRRLSRLASLGLLPTVGVLDAGCGNDPGGATSSVADRNNEARDAQLKDARCMRDHGVDMPDPTFEGDGRSTQTGPDLKDLKRPKFREAEQACKKHLEGIEPPNLSEEEQQEFEDAAPANARCVREHGIENLPDPTFGENGEARIKLGQAVVASTPRTRTSRGPRRPAKTHDAAAAVGGVGAVTPVHRTSSPRDHVRDSDAPRGLMTRKQHVQGSAWVRAPMLLDPRPVVRHDVHARRDVRGRP